MAPRRLFVERSVQVDQSSVERPLIGGIEADDRVRDLTVDVADSPQHTLAEIRGRVSIAQLDGLVLARRGTGRHDRASQDARREPHVDLDRRVATRVEELPGVHFGNRGHARVSFARS